MNDDEIIDLLSECKEKCAAFSDVLEGLELKIRDILPPRASGADLRFTTEDVADFIEDARDRMANAADAAIQILDSANKERP